MRKMDGPSVLPAGFFMAAIAPGKKSSFSSDSRVVVDS
jgi:hypothetical protein